MKARSRMYRSIKYALLAAIAAWLIHFVFFTKTGGRLTHANVQQLSELLRSFGPFAILLGMAAVLVQTVVPFVPFVFVAGANVLAFGLVKGFVINYTMAVFGSWIAFFFARHFGHDWAERKLAKFAAVRQFSRRMETHGFFYVLVGRLIPVLPSTVISLAAGVSSVKPRHFIAATIIGKLPMIVLESFIGHDLLHFRRYRSRLLVLLLIFVLLMAIGSLLKTKLTRANGEKESGS